MKIKITRKAAAQMNNVRSAGYCDLQNLLHGLSPIAYTSGIYGWNFDVYALDGLTICTGYRGMPGPRAEGIREFENRAAAIMRDYETPFDVRTEQLKKLRGEFVKANRGG